MAFSRARALRNLQSSLRHSGQRVVPRVAASGRTQLVQRRYASGGGHGEQKSSDIPWAVGAVAVTIPSCWYLWPEESHGDHGGHGDHAEHKEEEEKEEEAPAEEAPAEEAPAEEESKEDAEESKDEAKEDKSEEDKGEEKEQGKPTEASGNADRSLPPGGDDSQTKKGGGKEEGGEDSGDASQESEGGEQEEKSQAPKGKGGYNKRTDPTKRPKGEQGSMEQKQYGFSNTDTRHPYMDREEETSKRSKKGDGTIETSKTMGTVDPARPLK